jgi:16S rRNA (guanine(966)-N(2))-methyltransferase RsmD
MRIIAGSLKGRRLKTPAWEGLRPTSDKLRETLFNVLGARVGGARVLDGFAGTGSLGIEALSRGAAGVTFIEQERRAQALIAENLALCGVTNGCAIIRASFARGLDALGADSAFVPFDIVLLDPPYDQPPETILQAAAAVTAPDGIVVLEHARRREAPRSAGPLVRIRHITSGDSALSLYQLAAATGASPLA